MTLKKNAARVAVQAEPCQNDVSKSLSKCTNEQVSIRMNAALEAIFQVEMLLSDLAKRMSDDIEETVDRLLLSRAEKLNRIAMAALSDGMHSIDDIHAVIEGAA